MRPTARTLVALLAALAMIAPTPALAGHLPGTVATEDPDDGHTLKLLVDDHSGGNYSYVEADASANKDTLATLLAGTGDPALESLAETLQDTNSTVREAGIYTQQWTRQDSPMLTMGVYQVDDVQGTVRLPLVIFENVNDRDDLAEELVRLTTQESVDLVAPSLSFVLEAALVEANESFDTYPNPADVDTYSEQPTIYAWHVRRAEAGTSVWQGLYLARSGHHGGQNQGPGSYDGERRIEIGTATRVDGTTEHVAGIYAEATVDKQGNETRQESRWSLTVGTHNQQTGDVPVTTLNASDVRTDEDGELFFTPDDQRTRFTLGVWADGEYVPLIGAQTLAEHRGFPCPDQPEHQPNPQRVCVEQTRTTSLGVYEGEDYRAVTGVRFHGERFPLSAWPLIWLDGGGPGTQNVGDFELQIGVYPDDQFQPVAGAHYDDAFEHAQYTYQAMVSAGVYAVDYQPLVAHTYDGARPFLVWLETLTEDESSNATPWVTSAGTFTTEDYAPLVGARYRPDTVDGDREHQHQVSAGFFLADYRFFVPVLGAQWDGEQGPVVYAQDWTFAGGPGAQAGDWEANAGTFVLDSYQPLIGVRTMDDYASTTGDKSAEQRTVIGVYEPDNTFVPIAGVTYTSEQSLVQSVNDPTRPGDDAPFRATAGVYVDGQFVPLAGVHHGPSGTQATGLPMDY